MKISKSILEAVNGFIKLTVDYNWDIELALECQYDSVYDELSKDEFILLCQKYGAEANNRVQLTNIKKQAQDAANKRGYDMYIFYNDKTKEYSFTQMPLPFENKITFDGSFYIKTIKPKLK